MVTLTPSPDPSPNLPSRLAPTLTRRSTQGVRPKASATPIILTLPLTPTLNPHPHPHTHPRPHPRPHPHHLPYPYAYAYPYPYRYPYRYAYPYPYLYPYPHHHPDLTSGKHDGFLCNPCGASTPAACKRYFTLQELVQR